MIEFSELWVRCIILTDLVDFSFGWIQAKLVLRFDPLVMSKIYSSQRGSNYLCHETGAFLGHEVRFHVIACWRDDLVRGSLMWELSGPAVSGVSCCWAATDMKLPPLPSPLSLSLPVPGTAMSTQCHHLM